MELGIVQGRLVKPVGNHIQEFPFDEWYKELVLLDGMKINHIEWIVTKNSFIDNPIFTRDLTRSRISSICADNLIDERIIDKEFLKENLLPLCKATVKQEIYNITIPLLEESSMVDDIKRQKFIEIFNIYVKHHPDINFSIEAELGEKEILEIIGGKENIKVTYDTGNMTSFGVDHRKYINLVFSKINNIHIKDRTFDGKTVEPGKGDTDFQTIFDVLNDNNYKGLFTLQTCRGETGSEIQTINYHRKFFERIYNEQTKESI